MSGFVAGIKTSHNKWFTIESFGDQLNANGPSLRNKQVFTIQADENGKYSIKGPNQKYLSSDHKGKIFEPRMF